MRSPLAFHHEAIRQVRAPAIDGVAGTRTIEASDAAISRVLVFFPMAAQDRTARFVLAHDVL
jgi:hypothetical protein